MSSLIYLETDFRIRYAESSLIDQGPERCVVKVVDMTFAISSDLQHEGT